MIGETFEAQPAPPTGLILNALAAVILTGLAVQFKSAALVAAAVIFAVIAITLFVSREGRFRFRIDQSGLALLNTGDFIGYSEIQSVSPGPFGGGSFPQFSLDLHTHDRFLRIPASINFSTAETERFLRARLPPRIVAVPDPDVDDYLNRQLEQFGAERVFWYAASRPRPAGTRNSIRRGWLALLIASVPVLVAGIVMFNNPPPGPRIRRNEDAAFGVIAVGAIGIFVGLVGVLAHVSMGRRTQPKIKHIEFSSLVLSPLGIALRQGDLKGELRWEEIRGVKLRRNRPLVVQLAGVTVSILNIYDRSLDEIHARMRECMGF